MLTKPNSLRTRTLSMEQLEGRNLMAGNVTVTFSSGDLIVKGDQFNNRVKIERVSIDQWTISGEKDGFAGSMTTINGRTTPLTFKSSRVSDDVSVVMGSGDDRVAFFSRFDDALLYLDIPDDLNVDTGSGKDLISLERLTAEDVFINDGTSKLGPGVDDFVRLEDVEIFGSLQILDSASSSSTESNRRALASVFIQKNLTITTSAGKDSVTMASVAVLGTTKVSMGAGDDFLDIHDSSFRGSSALDGGTGFDTYKRIRNQGVDLVGKRFDEWILA